MTRSTIAGLLTLSLWLPVLSIAQSRDGQGAYGQLVQQAAGAASKRGAVDAGHQHPALAKPSPKPSQPGVQNRPGRKHHKKKKAAKKRR